MRTCVWVVAEHGKRNVIDPNYWWRCRNDAKKFCSLRREIYPHLPLLAPMKIRLLNEGREQIGQPDLYHGGIMIVTMIPPRFGGGTYAIRYETKSWLKRWKRPCYVDRLITQKPLRLYDTTT